MSNRNNADIIDFHSESSDEDLSNKKHAKITPDASYLDDDIQFEDIRRNETPVTEDDVSEANSTDSFDEFDDEELGSMMPATWQESVKLENAVRKRMGFRRRGTQQQGAGASKARKPATSGTPADDKQAASLATLHHSSASKPQHHLEDPLGLVRDNIEGLEEFHYGEKFNPKRFLARVHKDIPYERLLSGHSLAKKDEFRQRQMQELVGSNLHRFVKAKDTVVELHDRNILRIEHTETLIRSYLGLQADSKSLFGKMIKRKKRTEKIKEVLAILRRHQYVFDIPSNIIHNMDRCDYNQVVHDYKKAKSVRQQWRDRMGISDVPILMPIFEKIDSQIEKLRQILFRELQLNMHTLAMRGKKQQSMATPNMGHRGSIAGAAGVPTATGMVAQSGTSSSASVHSEEHSQLIWVPLLDEERERVITYLLNLDSPVDPAWYYLDQIYSYIVQTLRSTSKKYLDRIRQMQIAFLIKEEQDQESPKARSKKHRRHANKLTAKDVRALQKLNIAIERECYKLIRSLGNIMVYYLEHFWTLSENILNNKYIVEGSVSTVSAASSAQNATTQRMDQEERQEKEEKEKQQRLEESQTKIRRMLNEIVDCYIENCNKVLEEVDNGQAHQQTLCKCVQSIVTCHYSLEERVNIQKSYLASLKKYTFTQHKNIINETWERTIREIGALGAVENWRQISETVQITHLPLLFFNHMKRTLSLLRPFMELKSRNNERSPFFGMMMTHFCTALEAFGTAMHDLAFKTCTGSKKTDDSDSDENIADTGSSSSSDSDDDRRSPSNELDMERHTIWGASTSVDDIPSKEQQLILVLRNILHTNHMLFPQLVKLLYVLDAPAESLRQEISEFQRSQEYSKIENTYSRLTTMVLNSYIRRKTIQLLKFVEGAMKNNQLTHRPSGLRTYALEMLLELSLIHSRFENIATGSVNSPQHLRGIIGGETVSEMALSFDSDSDSDMDDRSSMQSRARQRRKSRKSSTTKRDVPSSVTAPTYNKSPLQQRDETLTTRIFESLCERLAELFMEFLVDSNYETIGENAALQLVIEITFIRKTLKKYESIRAKRIYEKIFQLIEMLSNWDPNQKKNAKLIKETLRSVKRQTRLQLESLRM